MSADKVGVAIACLGMVALAACAPDGSAEQMGCWDVLPTEVVQLASPVVAGPDSNGICSIRGEVARAFSGYAAAGDVITVSVPCLTGDAAQTAGVLDLNPTLLRNQAVIELHLGEGRSVYVGQEGYGVTPLARTTESPVWSDYLVMCT